MLRTTGNQVKNNIFWNNSGSADSMFANASIYAPVVYHYCCEISATNTPPAPDFVWGFEDGTYGALSHSGHYDVTTAAPHSGSYAWGDGADGLSDTMTLTRSLSSAGTISFYAYLHGLFGGWTVFYIDGVGKITLPSGTIPYTLYSFPLSAGTHTFSWNSGDTADAFYVDDIVVGVNSPTSTAALFNGGNVGIGTSAPAATLETDGTTLFKAASGADSASLFQVQNAAGASLIKVDSVNSNITLLGNNSGQLGAWSTNTNTIPAIRNYATSITANGYVYEIGGLGSGGTIQSTVYYAKLNADGSTGAWSTNANNMPAALWQQNTVVANGYIYSIGGTVGSTTQTGVYYAKLNADGSTGVWSTNVNNLPAARQIGTAVVANGYVYLIGGAISGTPQSSVYYAKLNADGSTGAWSTNPNTLPDSLYEASSVVANGYVYEIAGFDTSNRTSAVYYFSVSRLSVGANLDLVGLQGQTLADAGDSSAGSTGGSITAGNITAVGALQVQGQGTFVNGISIGGNVTVGGSALFQTAANSTVAFQVQDASSVTLLGVDTANRVITFAGDTTTFANITFNNAHVKSIQTTAPTIGTPTNCGSGTPTASVSASSTDSAGSFSITNNGSNGTTCDTVFTFNKAYGAAPKSILVAPKDPDAAVRNIYVSATSSTTFTVKFATSPTTNPTTFSFYYWVIE